MVEGRAPETIEGREVELLNNVSARRVLRRLNARSAFASRRLRPEMHNPAANTEYAVKVKDLQGAIQEWMKSQGDLGSVGKRKVK